MGKLPNICGSTYGGATGRERSHKRGHRGPTRKRSPQAGPKHKTGQSYKKDPPSLNLEKLLEFVTVLLAVMVVLLTIKENEVNENEKRWEREGGHSA